MSDNRESGIDFGALADDLDEASYPMTKAEVLDRFGDRHLEEADGATTLRDVLAASGDDEYRNAEAVRQAIMNLIGDQAIGRKDYTDRGASDAGNVDPDSF